MTLYDFLGSLDSTYRVEITLADGKYNIYSDCINLLKDEIKESVVEKWAVEGNVKILVTLADSLPSA